MIHHKTSNKASNINPCGEYKGRRRKGLVTLIKML